MGKNNEPESEYQISRALRLDPILQTLFTQMTIQDIKSCRSVNSQWSQIGLQILRKKSKINLSTINKRDLFFSLGEEVFRKFHGFSFTINDWTMAIHEQLASIFPKTLDLSICLDVNQDKIVDGGVFKELNRLILTFSKVLTSLRISVIWWKDIEPDTDEEHQDQGVVNNDHGHGHNLRAPVNESVLKIKLPQLSSLSIKGDQKIFELDSDSTPDLKIFENLWFALVNNSCTNTDVSKAGAGLQEFEIAWTNPSFWLQLTKSSLWNQLQCLKLQEITSEIPQTILTIKNLNLKRLTMQFQPGECDQILNRVAHSLEELIFLTPKESALSPITFPVMPKLQSLDTGNSQASFPSLRLSEFPILKELKVTYWDWVWTFEQLPEEYYYWRTSDPHPIVTVLDMRFPCLKKITGNYTVMENFVDFCTRLRGKFPMIDTIRLRNLGFRPPLVPCIVKRIVEEMRQRLKELTIIDYDEMFLFKQHLQLLPHLDCKDVEIWDLNPKEWLKIWNGVTETVFKYRDIDIPNDHFHKLRIIKLIWVEQLRLEEFVGKFPALEHLEIIGGRCIDRFDRRNMKTSYPKLTFVQHHCHCSEEDSWYMRSDSGGYRMFNNLFKE